jgi:hypothetical protein
MRSWLRARTAVTQDVTSPSFITAVYASGDVSFVPHNSDLGHTWEFSIVAPGYGGRPAADAWKLVLGGNVLAPSQPSFRMPPPSQVRISGG